MKVIYQPTRAEFATLAKQGNLVPVYCELPADLDTPVSIYLRLRNYGPSFLLESVEGGEHLGRYSFLGAAPRLTVVFQNDSAYLHGNNKVEEQPLQGRDPLPVLRDLLHRYRPVRLPGLPRFVGGLVGYLAYDVARYFERLPQTASDDLGLPDGYFLLTDCLLAFDHVKHRLLVIAHAYLDGSPSATYEAAVTRIEELVARLQQPTAISPQPLAIGHGLSANITRAQFEAMVQQAKRYIAAGDIFQVVLSQRFSKETHADPFAIYRALRMLNPSPYMFYLDLGDLRLIGSSPEMLVRLEDGVAEVRPIAGTRRRGSTEAEDKALEAELLADPKERAEHVMLVDLGRNDLGRVCRYGTVHVPTLMTVERYSHVMHLVSHVRGQLDGRYDAFDLVRACFPAGTVSGAPKVRAMEIIEELEGVRRGPYAGAVGYFSFSGNSDTCITIRTIVMHGHTAYIQAGAGIVADSDPAREYMETVHKAQALAEAITIAEGGYL